MGGAYTDQLLTTLVSANGTAVAKVGGAAGGGLNFVAPLTVTPTIAGADIGLTAAPSLGAATVTSLAFSSYDTQGPAVQATYTDATPHTLATFAVGAGQQVDIIVTIIASIGTVNGTPGTNSPISVGGNATYTGYAYRLGSGAVAANIETVNTIGGPFLPPSTTSAPGLVALVVSGNNVLLQVNGFAPTAWTTATAYVRGDGSAAIGQFVTSNGNVYLCTTSGTSSGAAPSGTGTSGTGAVFTYVCAGSTVPVQWTMGAPRVITG